MNRKLEFRVWDKELKQFASPNVHHLHKDGELMSIVLNLDISKISGNDRFIVQQFTGLTDINGQKIFEGDIVEWLPKNEKWGDYIHPVVWSPSSIAFVLDSSGRHLIDDKYGDYIPMHREQNYKITGNIFQCNTQKKNSTTDWLI